MNQGHREWRLRPGWRAAGRPAGIMLALWLAVMAGVAGAEGVPLGTVVEVAGERVRIALTAASPPAVGEAVTLQGEVAGLDMAVAVAGDWRIESVTGGHAWARNSGEPGTPEVGFRALTVGGGASESPGNGTAGEQPGVVDGASPPAAVAGDAPPADCAAGVVCREPGTGLPLRVLARPLSHVYATPDTQAAVVEENVPAFFPPWYVFARRGLDYSDPAAPRGWYQVGRGTDADLGWMRARDLLEWRQALLVSYTHPGSGEHQRQRVLMFERLEPLRALVQADDTELQALALYRRLRAGDVPDGVVSKEPEGFVDITERFYLLPVVEFEAVDLMGEDVRYLRIAAAVPGERGADTLRDEATRDALMQSPPGAHAAEAVSGIDVVFVMDMTTSMQPYMDATRAAVERLARRIAADQGGDLGDRIRFGLVGYRDDIRDKPALEFTARNFTPMLVGAEELSNILRSEARAAIVSSRGYAEDMYAGVSMALNETAWNRDSLKFLIIVGDASAHPAGHEQNSTGMDANMLRLAAEDRQIHRMAWHLRDPAYPADHPVAAQQLETLTEVRAADRGESAVVAVDVDEPEAFAPHVEEIARLIAERLGDGATSPGADSAAPVVEGPAVNEDVASSRRAFNSVFDAALVEYLGREADPPKDFTAWVLDRDLTDTTVPALDVRVMITRAQLNDLIVGVDTVMGAVARAEVSQQQFFDALQAVAAQSAKNPERIAAAQALKDAGLLPAFVASLPYKSDILHLNEEMFAAMTADERYSLIQSLRAKVQQYRDINESDRWIALNPDDPATDQVYPLSLETLP